MGPFGCLCEVLASELRPGLLGEGLQLAARSSVKQVNLLRRQYFTQFLYPLLPPPDAALLASRLSPALGSVKPTEFLHFVTLDLLTAWVDYTRYMDDIEVPLWPVVPMKRGDRLLAAWQQLVLDLRQIAAGNSWKQ